MIGSPIMRNLSTPSHEWSGCSPPLPGDGVSVWLWPGTHVLKDSPEVSAGSEGDKVLVSAPRQLTCHASCIRTPDVTGSVTVPATVMLSPGPKLRMHGTVMVGTAYQRGAREYPLCGVSSRLFCNK